MLLQHLLKIVCFGGGAPSQEWWDAHLVSLQSRQLHEPASTAYHHDARDYCEYSCNICGDVLFAYSDSAPKPWETAGNAAAKSGHVNGLICPNAINR